MNQTIGRETTIEIGGKKYKLSRFDRLILEQFLDWADKHLGHPLDQIKDKLKDFPPDIQRFMIQEAMSKMALRRSFNSPEVRALLVTPEGSMKLCCLLFQRYQPDLTDKDVEKLYEAACDEHGYGYMEKVITRSEGVMPIPDSDIERETLIEFGLVEEDKVDQKKRPPRRHPSTGTK
jgi:hypothetical protein